MHYARLHEPLLLRGHPRGQHLVQLDYPATSVIMRVEISSRLSDVPLEPFSVPDHCEIVLRSLESWFSMV